MAKRYTKDHEWIETDGDVATVGITGYAQEQLGDVVYVEVPEPGVALKKGESFGVVESVKAASDIYAPASGEVVEANGALADAPETINEDAEGAGWLVKVRLADPSEVEGLMDKAAYDAFLKTID